MNIHVLRSDPDALGEAAMEFRLTYQGRLFGATGTNKRSSHKHEIRKVFHRQLLRFWQTHPYLKDAFHAHPQTGRIQPEKKLFVHLAEQWVRLGYSFVPLVTEELSLLCRVNILLLRPTMPGQVIIQSGDLDNRLKTIFDALRLPHNKDELGGYAPASDEHPFCCLLEDDKLISHVSIETDVLLEPVSNPPDDNDVRLVISVQLQPINQGWHNINFGSY